MTVAPTDRIDDAPTSALPGGTEAAGTADGAETGGSPFARVRTSVVSVPRPVRGDALSFAVTAELGESRDGDQGQYRQPLQAGRFGVVDVALLVNGRPLLAASQGVLFDAFRVLVRRDAPGVFDPYTCGCGEAGCAGIFWGLRQALTTQASGGSALEEAPALPDEHHLVSTADTVRWRFPLREPGDGGFLGRLSEGWPVVDGAYELRFAREHFLAALDALRDHLVTLTDAYRTTFDAPMTVLPDYDPAEILEATRSLVERLPEWQDDFAGRQAQDAAYRAAYGALHHRSLEATLPNGRRYTVYLTQLAYLLAERSLGLDPQEANDPGPIQAVELESIAPAWRDEPRLVLAVLGALPWSVLNEVVGLSGYGPEDGDGETMQELDDDAMAAQWAGATYTWVDVER